MVNDEEKNDYFQNIDYITSEQEMSCKTFRLIKFELRISVDWKMRIANLTPYC